MKLLTAIIAYIAVGLSLYGVHYIRSRKYPEYPSMRFADDFLTGVACAIWPLSMLLVGGAAFSAWWKSKFQK